MIRQDTMEQIIRSQQEQIAGLLETNRSLVESNGKLLEQTDALQRKIQELLSQIAWLNRQLFGRRSEKLAALDPNQLSLFDSFNEVEYLKQDPLKEPEITEVRGGSFANKARWKEEGIPA